MKKRIFLHVFAVLGALALFTSCGDDDDSLKMPDMQPETKEYAMADFAVILSKTVHDSKPVRELLKEEAVNGDGNIPYESVKDRPIDGTTLRRMLIANSSAERIGNIEAMLPQLNIWFPDILKFGKTTKNYDADDAELPVAVAMPQEDLLFVGGRLADILTKEDIPDFHVLVVSDRSVMTNTDRKKIHPNYASITMKEAYRTFNSDGADNRSRAFQRDFAYYGMTPDGNGGEFDGNVKEYISYMEVNPNSYSHISDDSNERLDMIWTGGTYTFKFSVAKSTGSRPLVMRADFRPDEIWDFDIDDAKVRGAAFNGSKHVYTVNTDKLKAKRYYFHPDDMSFGAWNLAEEAVSRYIVIEEEDAGKQTEAPMKFNWRRLAPACFDGGRKLVLGEGVSIKNGLGALEYEITTDLTDCKTTVNMPESDSADVLGSLTIDYADPLMNGFGDNFVCLLHEYNTGSITFAIAISDRTK